MPEPDVASTLGPVHPVHGLSEHHVATMASLDPDTATRVGIVGHEHRITDHSPAGLAARASHLRSTRAQLDALPPAQGADRIAVDFHRERISAELDLIEAGEPVMALRVLSSPVQTMRQVFDLLPTQTDEDWEVVAERIEQVPAALAGLEELLRHGIDTGLLSSQRQARACALQAATWAGREGTPSYFAGLVAGAPASEALGSRLERAAVDASQAYGALADFLLDVYLPSAPARDAAGRERYLLHARRHLGSALNPDETYEWGWDELRRLEEEMARVADRLRPGHTLDEVIDHLDGDPAGTIEGADNLRAWLQDLMDRTVDDLAGTHFDIPDPIRRVEAMIAPPGGAAAMYYTGPSQDMRRTGRTWYPTQGRTRFPLWGEVSVCYHEGVPGHHLQVATVTYLGEQLTALQRTSFVAGHGEGWALYAERLMDELGYLEDDAARLGYLRAQVMRARRVVTDIGLHLGLTLPADAVPGGGSRWEPELARQFMTRSSGFPPEFMASEIDRYLGLPGQAISYKVGERVWLEGREEARRRTGPGFDVRAFHGRALRLGHLGLDQLRAELIDVEPRAASATTEP
jgi:uncharacterized protein (DUF885 family)